MLCNAYHCKNRSNWNADLMNIFLYTVAHKRYCQLYSNLKKKSCMAPTRENPEHSCSKDQKVSSRNDILTFSLRRVWLLE